MIIKKVSIFAVASIVMISCSSTEQIVEKHVEDSITESVDSSISELEDKVSDIAEDISAEEFKVLIDKKDGVVLDVRTKEEVAAGKIEGAINLDYYSATFKEDIMKLDKDVPVYVYCKSGGRSTGAKKIMVTMGFKAVYNLKGGYSNWPYK